MTKDYVYKRTEKQIYRSSEPSASEVVKKKLAQTTVLGTVSLVTFAGAPTVVTAHDGEAIPSEGSLTETTNTEVSNVVTLGDSKENETSKVNDAWASDSTVSEEAVTPEISTTTENTEIEIDSEKAVCMPEHLSDSGMSTSQLSEAENTAEISKGEAVAETSTVETSIVASAPSVTKEKAITTETNAVVNVSTNTTVPAYVPNTGSLYFLSNSSTEEFVEKVGEAARKLGQENDLYASVMIAQAILESGSGGSQLSQAPYYNLFGIKGSDNGKSVVFHTQEDNGDGSLITIESAFKAYDNYEGSFQDYVNLMKEGVSWNPTFYQGTWKSNATTYEEATYFLTGRYATDIFYHLKLNGLIETYDLTRFDVPKETETIPVS